jgi:HK97 family phage major capsid protein
MSKSIKELLSVKAIKRDSMKAITAKESDDAPLSDEDVASFENLKAECDKLEERIARLRAVQDDDADKADEVTEDAGEKAWTNTKTFGIHVNQPAGEAVKTKGGAAGQWLVGQYMAKTHGLTAARDFVKKNFRSDVVAKAVLTTSQPIIPQDFVADWIRLLQEKSVLRQVARIMAMPNGNLTIPRQDIGSVGSWFGEAAAIPVSQLGFDNIQLSWHKYGALTYCDRELLEFSPIDAASIISEDLTSRLALLEDRTLLNGSGGSYAPTGLLTAMASGNIFANSTASSVVTFQTVAADLQTAELMLTGNLVRGKFTWIMHPGVVGFLKGLSSNFGIYPFRDELAQGKLNGHDVLTTVQLPTNLGTSGANKTNVLLVCGDDIIIGDAYRFAVSMTTEGSFVDSSTQVNAFGQELIAWKATNAIDMALRHNVAVACIQASGWSLSTVAGMDYYSQTANTSASTASSAID